MQQSLAQKPTKFKALLARSAAKFKRRNFTLKFYEHKISKCDRSLKFNRKLCKRSKCPRGIPRASVDRSLLLFLLVAFDKIAHAHIVVALDAHAALITFCDLFDIIFKALE